MLQKHHIRAAPAGKEPKNTVSGPVLFDAKHDAPMDVLDIGHVIWRGDSEAFLTGLPKEPLFDLVVTSPPYKGAPFLYCGSVRYVSHTGSKPMSVVFDVPEMA